MSKGKYYFSKSLEKGLRILSLFNVETPALTQSGIAKILGLNMTSTYRYINTLVEMGYLEKDAKTKEIRPSIQCLLMYANLMQAADKIRMIRAVVDRLHRENNISIDVALAVEDALVRMYHREAMEALTYSLPESSKDCLHNTALGKAYLASLPDEELRERILKLKMVVRTEKTIVDRNLLFEEIQLSKQRGYAMQEEEYLLGVLAIAAPLFDPISGEGIGAVSFDFSIVEHTAAIIREQYGDLIRDTAATLSELMVATGEIR